VQQENTTNKWLKSFRLLVYWDN